MENWESEVEQNLEPSQPEPAGKPRKDTSGGRELYLNVRVLVTMMAAFVMVFTFAARIIVVSGPSMENTLWGGDLILVRGGWSAPSPRRALWAAARPCRPRGGGAS